MQEDLFHHKHRSISYKMSRRLVKLFLRILDGLQLQLGPPPVSPLGVVADGVARPHSDPLGDGAILLKLFGELALDAESLVGRLEYET